MILRETVKAPFSSRITWNESESEQQKLPAPSTKICIYKWNVRTPAEYMLAWLAVRSYYCQYYVVITSDDTSVLKLSQRSLSKLSSFPWSGSDTYYRGCLSVARGSRPSGAWPGAFSAVGSVSASPAALSVRWAGALLGFSWSLWLSYGSIITDSLREISTTSWAIRSCCASILSVVCFSYTDNYEYTWVMCPLWPL